MVLDPRHREIRPGLNLLKTPASCHITTPSDTPGCRRLQGLPSDTLLLGHRRADRARSTTAPKGDGASTGRGPSRCTETATARNGSIGGTPFRWGPRDAPPGSRGLTVARGTLALMGSGELTATMVQVHKDLLSSLDPSPQAVFLDTPAGFELNVDQISERVVEYFRRQGASST